MVNQFGIDLGFYLLIPYLATYLGSDCGMSAALVGVVLSVCNLFSQSLFLLGGTATDRVGAHRVIPAGCALRSVGFALFACGDRLTLVLVAATLSGVSTALFYPAVRAYVAVESPHRRAEAFGLLTMFSTAGGLVGLLLGSALFLIDFRMCALAASLVFGLLAVGQLLVLPHQRTGPRRPGVLKDWRTAVRTPGFVVFAATMSGMPTLENQLFLLMPDGARQASGWDGAGSIPPTLGTIVNLTLQPRVIRALQTRGGGPAWVTVGLALMGLGFLPAAVVADAGGHPCDAPAALLRTLPLAMGVCVMCLGVTLAQPVAMDLVPRFGPEELTGTYFGFYYVVSGLSAASGNLLVGWAMDQGRHQGDGWLPWACCAALGLLSACAAAWLWRLRLLPAAEASTTLSAA